MELSEQARDEHLSSLHESAVIAPPHLSSSSPSSFLARAVKRGMVRRVLRASPMGLIARRAAPYPMKMKHE